MQCEQESSRSGRTLPSSVLPPECGTTGSATHSGCRGSGSELRSAWGWVASERIVAWEGAGCAPPGRSDGAGALAHPECQAHGAGAAHLLNSAPLSDGSSLQALALAIGVANQHLAGILEELLLSHDRFGC